MTVELKRREAMQLDTVQILCSYYCPILNSLLALLLRAGTSNKLPLVLRGEATGGNTTADHYWCNATATPAHSAAEQRDGVEKKEKKEGEELTRCDVRGEIERV